MIARLIACVTAITWAGSAWAVCSSPGACSCTISLTSIAFGSYDPFSISPNDTVGTISISCVSPDPANSTMTVALSAGGSGNVNAREMKAGIYKLYYNLYTNAARTILWGDGSGGGNSVTANFPPTSRTSIRLSVYGRIPASQNASVGSYHDSVTVTVTY